LIDQANRAWVAYRRPRGSHRKRRQSVYGRIHAVSEESLVRNSVFLTSSTILTAVCGFGATSLLTHLFPVQAVGLSAAAVSAGGLIDFLTQFGISYSLPRFLPTSTRRAALINTMLTLTMAAALLGACIFLALPAARRIYGAGGWAFMVVFLFGTTLNAGETNLAVVFVADRSADKIARATIVMSLVNLVAPTAFRFGGMTGAYVARVIAGTAGFFVFVVMLARRGHEFRPMLSAVATRGLRRFSVNSYMSNILSFLPQLVLPIIILSRFGASATAYWYTAMIMASTLTSIPGSVSRALLPEASSRPAENRALVRRSAILMIGISIPMLVIAYLAAPIPLAVFGHSYAMDSLAPLRLLIIAGFAAGINYTTGSILVIAKKAHAISIANAAAAAVVLGMALIWAKDLGEIAACWDLGVAASTILFAVFAAVAIHEVRGRWENLGGDRPGAPTSTPGVSRKDPQEEAMEMLFYLARLQKNKSPQWLELPTCRTTGRDCARNCH
jgi:O-antigen/teichoic acid export membrane protein